MVVKAPSYLRLHRDEQNLGRDIDGRETRTRKKHPDELGLGPDAKNDGPKNVGLSNMILEPVVLGQRWGSG